MKPVLPTLGWLALALALVACADRDTEGTAAPEPRAPATAAAVEQPAGEMPPANPPSGSQPSPAIDAAGPMPATGAIGFEGFGPAPFGADAEAVRQAWGGELDGLPRQGDACYHLSPPIPPGSGFALAFMIEHDEFVRIDVAREGIDAPGGGEVGMSTGQVEALYPDLERRDHKYVEGGRYLRVEDPDGGDGVLVFETGADGIVTAWRVGVPPQVDYVEGCS